MLFALAECCRHILVFRNRHRCRIWLSTGTVCLAHRDASPLPCFMQYMLLSESEGARCRHESCSHRPLAKRLTRRYTSVSRSTGYQLSIRHRITSGLFYTDCFKVNSSLQICLKQYMFTMPCHAISSLRFCSARFGGFAGVPSSPPKRLSEPRKKFGTPSVPLRSRSPIYGARNSAGHRKLPNRP
jgi:hypothetical protein